MDKRIKKENILECSSLKTTKGIKFEGRRKS